jgi:outer membrane protein OmpU
MRKFLLTSTALVGAFAFVDRADAQMLTTDSPFTVRIDGFANFRGGLVSDSNQTGVMAPSFNAIRAASPKINGDNAQFKTDTEIHITATGKADNGLVYGMYVEIEADPALSDLTTTSVNTGSGATGPSTTTTVPTSASNYIDEANIFLQGTWGRVELGDQDGAGDQLFFGAPFDYGPAYGQGSGADGDVLFRFSNTALIQNNATSNINGAPLYSWNIRAIDSSDATKITYLSPVISGFRAGISYVPNGAQNGFLNADGSGVRSGETLTSLATANIGVPGLGAATANANSLSIPGSIGTGALPSNKGAYGDFEDWIEAGAQWRGTFGDVGLGIMSEYTHASHKSSLFTPAGANQPSTSLLGGSFAGGAGQQGYHYVDINSFAVGGQASWMGFTVGGSFSDHFRSTYLTGPGLRTGSDAYDIAAGLQYAIGPWVVGYNYSYSQDAGSLSPLNATINGGGSSQIEEHSLGAKYILAPGLFLFTEYAHYRIMDNGVNVDYGNVGLVGTGIRF